MNSQQKIINLLTMCRRANKFTAGFDAVKDGAAAGDVCCVIVTADISPNTFKEVSFFSGNSNVPVVKLALTSDELCRAAGKKYVVMGIRDKGFADRFESLSREIEQQRT